MTQNIDRPTNATTSSRPSHAQSQPNEFESLHAQLSLELQLRQNCQVLLNLYKDTPDWEAVSQLTQTLITNSQRIATVRERLCKAEGQDVKPSFASIRETRSPSPRSEQGSDYSSIPEEVEEEGGLSSIASGCPITPNTLDCTEELGNQSVTVSRDLPLPSGDSVALVCPECGKHTTCLHNRSKEQEDPPQHSKDNLPFTGAAAGTIHGQLGESDKELELHKQSINKDSHCEELHGDSLNPLPLSNSLTHPSHTEEPSLIEDSSSNATSSRDSSCSPVKSSTHPLSTASSRGDISESSSELFFSPPESLSESQDLTPLPLPDTPDRASAELVDNRGVSTAELVKESSLVESATEATDLEEHLTEQSSEDSFSEALEFDLVSIALAEINSTVADLTADLCVDTMSEGGVTEVVGPGSGIDSREDKLVEPESTQPCSQPVSNHKPENSPHSENISPTKNRSPEPESVSPPDVMPQAEESPPPEDSDQSEADPVSQQEGRTQPQSTQPGDSTQGSTSQLEASTPPKDVQQEDRPEIESGQQEDRPESGQQEDQPESVQQEGQPESGQQEGQPESGQQEDRPESGQQEDRPESGQQEGQPESGQQEDRPESGQQEDRPESGQQEDRPESGQQEDRPESVQQEDRPESVQQEDSGQLECTENITEPEDTSQQEDSPQPALEGSDTPPPESSPQTGSRGSSAEQEECPDQSHPPTEQDNSPAQVTTERTETSEQEPPVDSVENGAQSVAMETRSDQENTSEDQPPPLATAESAINGELLNCVDVLTSDPGDVGAAVLVSTVPPEEQNGAGGNEKPCDKEAGSSCQEHTHTQQEALEERDVEPTDSDNSVPSHSKNVEPASTESTQDRELLVEESKMASEELQDKLADELSVPPDDLASPSDCAQSRTEQHPSEDASSGQEHTEHPGEEASSGQEHIEQAGEDASSGQEHIEQAADKVSEEKASDTNHIQEVLSSPEPRESPDQTSPEHKGSDGETSPVSPVEGGGQAKPSVKRGKSITHAIKKKTKRIKRSFSQNVKKMDTGTVDSPSVKPLSPITGTEWDPTCLLEELYSDYRQSAITASKTGESARHFGYLQKLPMNKTKPALGKGYKRRYFRAMEGNLYYYEDRSVDKALGFVRLETSRVVPLSEKHQIQIVQKDGKSLMLRASDQDDFNTWHKHLLLEAAHPTQALPGSPLPTHNPGLVIIDIGSCSVRAGFAGENAYPELFFPAVASLDATTQDDMGCGLVALQPENRYGSLLIYPRKVSRRMDQRDANTQLRALDSIVGSVVDSLNVEPRTTQLILTLSPTVPEADRNDLMELLFESYGFAGICAQEQAVLALYSYNTTSGIVVDIGDHVDIVPIIDGYVIEAGVTRLPFGGNAVTESLSKLITARGIRYFSETESYIVRLIKERLCFVSEDYLEDVRECENNPVPYTNAMDAGRFQLPDHRKVVTLDSARFRAPEGLFTPGQWGKDVMGLHEHVWKAVQACPIDQRRQLAKNIYLSGGGSLLPGLQERLQKELTVLAGSGLPITVHADPSRQHAAYVGASVLASLGSFRRVNVVSLEEWSRTGVDSLQKWKGT